MTTRPVRSTPSVSLKPGPDLDEALVARVVDAFYDRARTDDVVGPIFNAHIAMPAWPEHLVKIRDFWSSMLLGSGRYEGRPMPKHVAMTELNDTHFLRWLQILDETTKALCEPDTAAMFMDRANRIAMSFRLQIAFHRGEDTVHIKHLSV